MAVGRRTCGSTEASGWSQGLQGLEQRVEDASQANHLLTEPRTEPSPEAGLRQLSGLWTSFSLTLRPLCLSDFAQSSDLMENERQICPEPSVCQKASVAEW